MNLNKRIELLVKLGEYLMADEEPYQNARIRAYEQNRWFSDEFTRHASLMVAQNMLNGEVLQQFAARYGVQEVQLSPKTIGLVMAGNVPLVGFHDLLCIFLSGHRQRIKLSSKDQVLIKHIIEQLVRWEPEIEQFIKLDDMLKGCDAYIATGSDNSSRYFEQYFARFPHIIRKNRTSIAILTGGESAEELAKLADDVHLYYGLGCRNVTQVFVPKEYDFLPMLNAFRKYSYFRDHEKYRNNFDYQLTIAIMNNRYYMSNDSIVLLENESPFSPISQLHYWFYEDVHMKISGLDMEKIQCIVGQGFIPFGKAQMPEMEDFPDGVDTMEFLQSV
jgi:Acyl-CoA reductase (LuxC)